MYKIKDLIGVIEKFAPVETQMPYDNCGYIFGYPEKELAKALITLDVTPKVVDEAIRKGCNLIISHHPLIFGAIKQIDLRFPTHQALVAAIKNDITIYASHTSMDFAEGGINDNFMKMIGAKRDCVLDENADFARIGTLDEPCSLGELKNRVAKVTNNSHVLCVGDENKKVNKIGFICGAGGSEEVLLAAKDAGADVFMSADFKYHILRLAKDLDYAIIDFGHFDSELQFEELVFGLLVRSGFENYIIKAENCLKPYND